VKALAIASLALLAGTREPPLIPSGGLEALCVPPPQRTTPRKLYERADKWQHDQRTIA
jgi:hypothetical protein